MKEEAAGTAAGSRTPAKQLPQALPLRSQLQVQTTVYGSTCALDGSC